MRLWSLHPKYLDRIGLVALWREGLLARKVLQGLTKGYRHHPQLCRFQASPDAVKAIDEYLRIVYEESMQRGFHFDGSKIGEKEIVPKLDLTIGQIQFEMSHLLDKFKRRSPDLFEQYCRVETPKAHPLFNIVPGDIEDWERVKT